MIKSTVDIPADITVTTPEQSSISSLTLRRLSPTAQAAEFMPIAQSRRLYLREVRQSDVNENYYRWMNDPEITCFLETRFVPRSRENIAAFVREMDGKEDEPFFAICLADDNRHIGNIKLGPINWRHRRADISLLIGDRGCWGKGLATEAIAMITKFGFETLNLRKLCAGCYGTNIGSAKAFEKCGYRREGLLRDHVLTNGDTGSIILLGMTAQDYQSERHI